MNERGISGNDLESLRGSIEVARQAREHGNHPFGALLVDEAGGILERAENTVITGRDITEHAEMNLIRMAVQTLAPESLERCTLYSNAEPCPMCSGAIFWSGIGRVVFALSAPNLYAFAPESPGRMLPTSRAILEIGGIQVLGPFLEEEAATVHQGFWE
jgi:tRNA(adenine34) deaminase